jgi:hypothetical protein
MVGQGDTWLRANACFSLLVLECQSKNRPRMVCVVLDTKNQGRELKNYRWPPTDMSHNDHVSFDAIPLFRQSTRT